MIRYLMIVLASLVFVGSGYAQDIKTEVLKWSSEEFLEEEKNSFFDHESYFLTHGSDSVIWYQKQGTYVNTFEVTSVEGSWSDVSKKGSIIYHIRFNDKSGFFKFQRDGDWIAIQVELSALWGNGSRKVFTVSSIELAEL